MPLARLDVMAGFLGRQILGVRVATCAAAIGWAAGVEACVIPPCTLPEFFPAMGSVPANLPAIRHRPATRFRPPDAGLSKVQWVRLAAGSSTEVDVAFTAVSDADGALLISPVEPLEVGARYVLTTQDCDGIVHAEPVESESSAPQTVHADFTVTEAAPLPTEPFSLVVGEVAVTSVQLADQGGGCAAAYPAATVWIEVDDADEPWADAIAWETRVDGQVYRPSDHLNAQPVFGFSWVGHARDLLVALCEGVDPESIAEDVLSPGMHTVQMIGSIPGSNHQVQTRSVSVEIPGCTAIDGAPPGAGPGDAPAASDRGASNGGCGCVVAPSFPSAQRLMWVVLAVGVAVGRRRANGRCSGGLRCRLSG